jgi:RNA polymerase-interacting CarD/CdnL/TRCF family regulator
MLYSEDKINPETFTKNKRDVFESAIDKLAQEVAVVSGITLEKARKKIDYYLHN